MKATLSCKERFIHLVNVVLYFRLTMACAVPEAVDKQLICAICIEQFKEPKVLPGLHTYCKGCLVKLVKKQGPDHVITCPECRQDTKVSFCQIKKGYHDVMLWVKLVFVLKLFKPVSFFFSIVSIP